MKGDDFDLRNQFRFDHFATLFIRVFDSTLVLKCCLEGSTEELRLLLKTKINAWTRSFNIRGPL